MRKHDLNPISTRCEMEDIAPTPTGYCEGFAFLRDSRTMYHYTEEDKRAGKPDPNRPLFLCKAHAEEYDSYWDDMWDQVPRG